ncbi:MAG: exonuclease domain-containing protein [Moheibacter sp.]
MYAVLDIEATGGKMGEESIIEVAIYKYDGKKVIDQLISLVSPDREINAYVQKLTKITTKMVKTAPKFHELAKRIIEITDGTILVGHNVEFDYRMLKQEFKKLGYNYYRETLDTVKLSEKLFPNATSYSLGKLSKELGIPVSDRHRAAGDARATLELLKILLEKDSEKEIVKRDSSVNSKPIEPTGKFAKYYKDLPNTIGVFYFLCADGNVIYLSKTRNIAQGVRKQLNAKTSVGNIIRKTIDRVHYEETGDELISWIKENHEIKTLQPKLNATLKKIQFPYSICLREKNGYKKIVIRKTKKNEPNRLFLMVSLTSAQSLLSLITEEFELCPLLNEITKKGQKCFSYEIGECFGACVEEELSDSYNKRVNEFLDKINLKNKNILLVGEGRKLGKSSFVWIKYGVCCGYGYYEFHHQIKNESQIKERMVSVRVDPAIDSIIKGFLFTEKYREIIHLENQSK